MKADRTKTLIVDDEAHVCALIRDELSECGFDCHIATEPQQAKELLDSESFGLLIADISMPHVNGLELLAYARRHCPACKVILITGVSNRQYVAQALALGAHDYIEKPFGTGELVEAATRAVADEVGVPQLPLRAAEAIQFATRSKQAALDGVQALVRAVEAKDPFTQRHSEQVTYYATNLARAIHVPEDLAETIRVASLLHDVGMIGVPDHILTKSGQLTEQELEQVRRHSAIGADILAKISMFATEVELVRHHHEAWNGSGYPDGLAGEEIPPGSRVIHVADSMDAMLMQRSYRASYPVEKMLDELIRCAGTQYDPKIAAAAVQWCRMNPDRLILPNKAVEAPQL